MVTDSKEVQVTARRKPPAAGKGRPKGAVNKLTKTIKEAIEVSFDQVGGPEYLARMALEQPQAYMTLLGKVLPTQVDANVTGQIGMAAITLGVQPE